MQKIMIFVLASTLFTGCATYRVYDMPSERTKTTTVLQDTIVGIAKPKTAIAGYEDAVVFIGNSHSFLVQEDTSTFAPVNFQKIFEHADLNYLYIDNNATNLNAFVTSVKQGIVPKPRKIALNNFLQNQEGTHSFNLKFVKPIGQMQTGEKQTLERLGMACNDKEYANYLVCHRPLTAKFTLVQNPNNKNIAQYTLKQPLGVQAYDTQVVGKSYAPKLLLPLAVAFDIVTFPIQAIMLANIDWH